MSTVHPRRGGDKASFQNPTYSHLGSSPRGRGQGVISKRSIDVCRFIPAGAGTRGTRTPPRRGGAVHPRGGGDKHVGLRAYVQGNGSSPRGRGQGPGRLSAIPHNRFIPAGAGTRSNSWRAARPSSVHPRGGGDKSAMSGYAADRAGSSPRGRGQVAASGEVARPERFIPAGAGTRYASSQAPRGLSVHPRGGGDKQLNTFHHDYLSGSSPRGRGQERLAVLLRNRNRFIPAGAGTRPRTGARHVAKSGSSPRGRGQGQPLAP